MSVWFQNFALLSEQVGLGVLLVYLYGVFARQSGEQWVIDCSLGIIFGLASLCAMLNPLIVTDGVIVDLRNLFVGVAAAYFGWRGGSLCALIAITTRYALGGAGAMAGMASILIAAVMGLIWLYWISPQIKNKVLSKQILGLILSLHFIGGLFLPEAVQTEYYTHYGPLMALCNIVGVNIFSLLISREKNLASEATRLYVEARADPLTGVLNRRSAVDAYQRILNAPRPKRGIAMTCIDVDKFKAINDTFGHLAGDQVLQEIAHLIGTSLRADNIVCRMSGDEFLFVLMNVTSNEAKIITERCRSLISRIPISCDEADIPATISLGTVWSAKPLHFEEFRSLADQALYDAKDAGRDRTSFKINYATAIRPNAA